MTPEQFNMMFPDVNATVQENSLESTYLALKREAIKYLEGLLVPIKEIGAYEVAEVHKSYDRLVFILVGGSYCTVEAERWDDCPALDVDDPITIDEAREHGLLPEEMGDALDEAAAALREHTSKSQALKKLSSAVKELGIERTKEFFRNLNPKLGKTNE
jgi:hypothetical protein